MTERKKSDIEEKSYKIFVRDGFKCRFCGESIYRYLRPQIAHGISQSRANVKKYGKEIIHSDLNLYSCCSLWCNDHLAIGFTKTDAEAERIRIIINER